jgi:hypothetical protein
MNVMDMLNNLDITHLVEKMDQPLPIFIYLILALSITRIPYQASPNSHAWSITPWTIPIRWVFYRQPLFKLILRFN